MKDLEICMRYALNARGERPSTCPAVVQGAVEKRHDSEIHRISARFSEEHFASKDLMQRSVYGKFQLQQVTPEASPKKHSMLGIS